MGTSGQDAGPSAEEPRSHILPMAHVACGALATTRQGLEPCGVAVATFPGEAPVAAAIVRSWEWTAVDTGLRKVLQIHQGLRQKRRSHLHAPLVGTCLLVSNNRVSTRLRLVRGRNRPERHCGCSTNQGKCHELGA